VAPGATVTTEVLIPERTSMCANLTDDPSARIGRIPTRAAIHGAAAA
jgi:hypothetical protein